MIIDKLKKIEKESILRGIPIIGSVKGKWLLNKVREIKPKRILEAGTANGYSGIILGSQGAKLTTIDYDKRMQAEAIKNFKEFGINANVITGDGVKEINKLSKEYSECFDLIFLDITKKKYIEVLEDCIKLVIKEGYIIADNISFPAAQDYKKAVLNHPKLETEIIDLEDGLSCSRRIS